MNEDNSNFLLLRRRGEFLLNASKTNLPLSPYLLYRLSWAIFVLYRDNSDTVINFADITNGSNTEIKNSQREGARERETRKITKAWAACE